MDNTQEIQTVSISGIQPPWSPVAPGTGFLSKSNSMYDLN
jgi:hypothetical protein